ncbi:hypothetical protein GTZ99_09480 [Novosphingobium sp. FSY-8]|uniref:Uncharacterized protein n=1 Tax=Novosphingobium ovatum TaxID=1908523 RepID=A0ABW9XE15_9SPHN|nr:hypothetical protein [Novosphingobium ovatum]NBC36786.1 hypothetical protein [Novosphingobium ovatum]
MRLMGWGGALCAGLTIFAVPMGAQGQTAPAPAAPVVVAQPQLRIAPGAAANDFVIPETLPPMPALDFVEKPDYPVDPDKYFYFHRDATTLEDALADIRECDALSSGANVYAGNSAAMAGAMAQYGVLAGGIGGAIGSAMADAIFGSARRRKEYKVNMRNCMGWKGYQRYALSAERWEVFNFEEGLGRKKEDVRNLALLQQAMVASGPKPKTKELGQ